MQAEHTEIQDILDIITCGALKLHVIAADYTNNNKECIFSCKPNKQTTVFSQIKTDCIHSQHQRQLLYNMCTYCTLKRIRCKQKQDQTPVYMKVFDDNTKTSCKDNNRTQKTRRSLRNIKPSQAEIDSNNYIKNTKMQKTMP